MGMIIGHTGLLVLLRRMGTAGEDRCRACGEKTETFWDQHLNLRTMRQIASPIVTWNCTTGILSEGASPYRMGKRPILRFAENTTFISVKFRNLKKDIHEFEKWLNVENMKINEQKCRHVTFT